MQSNLTPGWYGPGNGRRECFPADCVDIALSFCRQRNKERRKLFHAIPRRQFVEIITNQKMPVVSHFGERFTSWLRVENGRYRMSISAFICAVSASRHSSVAERSLPRHLANDLYAGWPFRCSQRTRSRGRASGSASGSTRCFPAACCAVQCGPACFSSRHPRPRSHTVLLFALFISSSLDSALLDGELQYMAL